MVAGGCVPLMGHSPEERERAKGGYVSVRVKMYALT